MKTRFCAMSIMLVPVVFLASCNLPANETGESLSMTAAAQTIQALASGTQSSFGLTTPSITPIGGIAATSTQLPTLAVITNTPVASPTSNCNAAQFIADVTIPDGTIKAPGESFTKKWRIKNIGSCTWNGFSLTFDSGDAMSGPASKPIGTVSPGQEVDLEVNLTAPAAVGNYRGYWRIVTNSSVLVPIVDGYQGKSFYVDIKVQNPVTATYTLPPAVAQVILNAVSGESGTLYEPAAGVPTTILAGDTSSNDMARGYMSFDISTLSGKTIQSASLALGSCSQMQDPFASLSGIWVGEVQYALPLDQSDFNISGTGILLLNALPGPIDVKSQVQTRVTEGKARFQIRLHPAAANSDGDNQADYVSCNAGSVTLTIVYQP